MTDREYVKPADRKGWLKLRRAGIGGSDVAPILGISPWRTPVQVWVDKTSQTDDEPDVESESMRLGTELEPYVARRYAEATGKIVRNISATIVNGLFIANIDRLICADGRKIAMTAKREIVADGILECKTTSSSEWNEVPKYYLTQVLHYMGCVPEVGYADVACLFRSGAPTFNHYRIERNESMIQNLREVLTEWWTRHVVNGEMPEPTSEDDCKLLWARSTNREVQATADIMVVAEDVRALREQATEIEAKKKEAELTIKSFMQDADTLVYDGLPILTYKSNKDRSVTDWQAVAQHLGADNDAFQSIVDMYTTSKPGARVMRLK